jgi:hypothetical protein
MENKVDAKSFSTFLKQILMKEAQKYEGNLLSTTYETITEAKRIGGIRDTLVGIANSLDTVLSDFYNQGGNNKVIETQEFTKENVL